MFNDNYDCSICLNRYAGTSNHIRCEMLQKQKGCFSNKALNKVDNICYAGCVGNFKDEYVYFLYDLFLNFERGILPYNTTYSNHPNKIIEIFNLISSIRTRNQLAKLREEKAKNKTKRNN